MDWYYSDGRQQFGPVNETEFDALRTTGRLTGASLVWRPGMPSWATLASIAPASSASAAPAAVATAAPAVRFCSQCGAAHERDDLLELGTTVVCAACKDTWVQRLREGVLPGGLTARQREYGGFWIRAGATITDGIILWMIQMIVTLPLTFSIGRLGTAINPSALGAIFGLFSVTMLIELGIAVIYEAAFVVYKGATPGKLALSLEVIREDGTRPGWGLAIGRYFAKLISSLTMGVGFIMAGLDDEKRALHDRICNTRVIRKTRGH